MLPISRDYFRLRRPIDRRLYELARKHCGRQATWRIGAANLQKKCGSKQAGKHFAAHLRGLVRSNHLPDYTVAFDGAQVVFSRRGDGAVARTQTEKPMNQCPHSAGSRCGSVPTLLSMLRELAPGWDRYALEGLYIEWAASKDAARSEDARFLGWVKSYTKGKPAP